jgi:hypothetical protein
MTCPAICIWDTLKFDGTFSYHNCEFYYLTAVKKYGSKWDDDVYGKLIEEWSSDEERYARTALWAALLIKNNDIVTIEGYSYGSSAGMVFNIAENTGVLKHKLWRRGINFNVVAPSAVKKFATGKGNASKEKMQEAFILDTRKDLKKMFGMTEKSWSPSGDIIDSYYICKYGASQYHEKEKVTGSDNGR